MTVEQFSPVPQSTDLVRFAEEASQVHGIAKALANTSFVPKSMQGKPDEITAAILAGRELGLPPMTAVQSIHVIEGRPSMSANALRGLAMSKGVVFEVVSASDTRVQMRAKAPGQAQWTPSDWPIERARKMGLTEKANWKKMPQAMLIARATSELCRLVAANVIIGMPYSVEEVEDLSDEAPDAEPVRKRRAKREPVQASVYPEPDLEQSWPAPSQDVPHTPAIGAALEEMDAKIQDKTRAAIMAGFKEIGVTDRTQRLQMAGHVVERQIHSVNDLTEAEGRAVVRKLVEARQAQPLVDDEPPIDDADWPEPAVAGS